MHDEGPAWGGFESPRPTQQFIPVSMRRQHGKIVHLGTDRHLHPKHLYGGRSPNHCGAPRASRLKASKDDAVLGIRGIMFKMMKHASAGGHAARGDYDLG